MGQSGDWRYSDDEQGRRGGPAVPPQWEQPRHDPRQQQYEPMPRTEWPEQPRPYPEQYRPAPRFTPQAPHPSRQQPPQGPYRPQREQYAPPPQPPPVRAPKASKTQQGKPGNPLVGFAIIFGVIGLAIWGLVSVFGGGGGGGNKSTPPGAAPAATVSASHAANANAKPGFPPTTLAGFQSFAATGDASQVHQVASGSEGLPSCPEPNFDVTVSPSLTGRALEADLSAFFVQQGVLSSQCQAFVFAYHSESDYQAHKDDGFTAGRVALTTTGTGSQMNIEVDTGSATNTQAEFDFNF